ncbi:DNA repair protein RecN [Aeromicrobium sp. A1-2]|uniref:DNA repair protein RecN n=1 Tax=Aeromicrobium sp. A1-2 TaxID=2107713 RepID=UPI000E5348EC|nr:DNA repair protein RecN [Aeromicrobium sp. A1-2]AXT85268.1 DNA repair protein RecN [Aeromicrobium sp. A1-2]
MWQHLRLSSLGVIDSAELELSDGFTVITGETGAGKTMVVTALGLLRGDRADLGLVRRGADQARVEASIGVPSGARAAAAVEEAGGRIDDDVVILGRVLSAQGRSRALAGGATVPAALLAEVTDELVAVHGQSDQHRLLRAAEQRAALDRFAGPDFAVAVEAYAPVYARWRAVERTLEELRTHAQERARELDVLQFGLDEIQAVDPQAGEDEQLKIEEGRLAHSEALARAADRAHRVLVGEADPDVARTQVAAASTALREASGHDPALDELGERVLELGILLDDVGVELGAYSAGVELDPERLATLQERRAALAGLQRKYGPTLDDVLAWAEKGAARLGELGSDDQSISALEAEQAELGPEVQRLAGEMSAIRTASAGRLSDLVDEEIAQLSMPSARLEVQVTSTPDAVPGPHGLDEVELLFAANSGTGLRPLHKGASGGELSRLMLALEVVLADRTTVPTLVFDEVDAGIGGKAAVEVGRRLARLAEHAQVIAVTHLPQVAAFADHHFVVSKDDDGTVTSSSVIRLDEHSRVDELARMLAGQEDSATAQAHARELLELARS